MKERNMKNIIFLVILTMIGCSDHKEDAIKEVVKGNLKDPQSAQFQNLYGYCGEVNSKNSYGGYGGFKKYIVVNQTVLMEDSDGIDPSNFSIIWQAHCTPNKLSVEERSECVKDAYNQSLIIDARLKGVTKEYLRQDILASKGASQMEIDEALKDLDRAYSSKFKDKDLYAQDIVKECTK